MINGAKTRILACLMAVFLMACEGPVKGKSGSLEGVERSSFVVHLQTDPGKPQNITKRQLRSAVEIVTTRLYELGIKDYELGQRDKASLSLAVPKMDEDGVDEIREALEKVVKLSLHRVGERSEEVGRDGRTLAQRVMDGDELVVGQKAYSQTYTDMDGNLRSMPILLYRRSGLGSADIAMAYPSPQQADAVGVTLSKDGTEKMIAFTKIMRPGIDRIAILLNGVVVSAPVVNQVPLGKHFIIEGLDEPGEVDRLAMDLMHPTGKPFRVEKLD